MPVSEAQKRRGYRLPEPVATDKVICLTVRIPDTPEYREAAEGALTTLYAWHVWEKSWLTGDTRASEAAQLFKDIMTEFIYTNCPTDCEKEDCGDCSSGDCDDCEEC
jgi:hypothetical protein